MPNASDYDAFVPTDGVVRNFRWQLTGVIEDLRDYDGYFGGEIRIFRYGDHEGGRLELTFTPTGPVIDGSTVAPFTRTLEPEDMMVYDVPVGEYRVTAALVGAGGRTPLRVGTDSADYESQTESALFRFESDGGCGDSNGTSRGFLYLNSPVE